MHLRERTKESKWQTSLHSSKAPSSSNQQPEQGEYKAWENYFCPKRVSAAGELAHTLMVAQQAFSLSLSLCFFFGRLDPASVGTAASKLLVLVLLSLVPVLIDGGKKRMDI